MKTIIVAIRDIKANYWNNPLFIQNIQVALRGIGDELNDPQNTSAMAKHPEDFELYELGTWESDTCQFELAEPKQLCVLTALKR